jgi:hypothetical protein
MQSIENDATMMPSRKTENVVRDVRRDAVVFRAVLRRARVFIADAESCVREFQRGVAGFTRFSTNQKTETRNP